MENKKQLIGKINGSCPEGNRTTTEFGGFVRNEDGEYVLLFQTELSELLCRERAAEKAAETNAAQARGYAPFKIPRYDENDILVLQRQKETTWHPWEPIEPEKTKECEGISFEESAACGCEGTGEVSLYFNATVEFGKALAPESYTGVENIMLTDLRIDVPCTFDANNDPEIFDLENIGAHVSPVVCDDPENCGMLESIDWTDVCLPEEMIRQCLEMAAEEDDLALEVFSAVEELRKYQETERE